MIRRYCGGVPGGAPAGMRVKMRKHIHKTKAIIKVYIFQLDSSDTLYDIDWHIVTMEVENGKNHK
jgi:hypothetical protein